MNKVRKDIRYIKMVPVLDKDNIPLMPCSEKRARQLMDRNKAKPYWQKGIFCIKLNVEPSARNYQEVVVGIDPGSKREGYTVATKKAVVLNITTNTPSWVKGNIETRRYLRRHRRYRKTPYRKQKSNRSSLRNTKVAPSTKARWNAKLRVLNIIRRILPITKVNVEDIKASTKEGKRRWNVSFSPLEYGKNWFYNQVRNLKLKLLLTSGKETSKYRKSKEIVDPRFSKSKNKLDYGWNSHCVDSHVLVEIALTGTVNPNFKIIKVEFIQFQRRNIHHQLPTKGGIRKRFGGTSTNGIPRGSVCIFVGKTKSKKIDKNIFYYLGGFYNGYVSIYKLCDGNIIMGVKQKNLKFLYISKWKIQASNQD